MKSSTPVHQHSSTLRWLRRGSFARNVQLISLVSWLGTSPVGWSNLSGAEFENTSPAQSSITSQFSQIDSDNDGLADWLEVQYQTSPHHPDFDGDSITDGDEVYLTLTLGYQSKWHG